MTPFCFKRLHNAVLTCLLAGACLASIAQAQTYSVLYQFKSGNDGTFPTAGVAIDTKRMALYGTTYADGEFSSGTVFKLNKKGETVLHSFTGESGDGAYPLGNGSLVLDAAGNLYGATEFGGVYGGPYCGNTGCGVVFKVDQSGNETILYEFPGGAASSPQGTLAIDNEGNVYGTTEYGNFYNYGTVFEIDPSGQMTTLLALGLAEATSPLGGVIRDASGNLFGTAEFGGLADGGGIVFEVSSSGVGKILYSFGSYVGDGVYPMSSLSIDTQGNLYGTTNIGGISPGYGTIFRVTPSGTESILYNFSPPGPVYPGTCGVILDSLGNIYGMTPGGGAYGLGTIYRLDTEGTLTVIHNFKGPDGKVPYGNLALDPSGNLYGTTSQGGKFGGGVIFRIKP